MYKSSNHTIRFAFLDFYHRQKFILFPTPQVPPCYVYIFFQDGQTEAEIKEYVDNICLKMPKAIRYCMFPQNHRAW